jgi:hypothetical protein
MENDNGTDRATRLESADSCSETDHRISTWARDAIREATHEIWLANNNIQISTRFSAKNAIAHLLEAQKLLESVILESPPGKG